MPQVHDQVRVVLLEAGGTLEDKPRNRKYILALLGKADDDDDDVEVSRLVCHFLLELQTGAGFANPVTERMDGTPFMGGGGADWF